MGPSAHDHGLVFYMMAKMLAREGSWQGQILLIDAFQLACLFFVSSSNGEMLRSMAASASTTPSEYPDALLWTTNVPSLMLPRLPGTTVQGHLCHHITSVGGATFSSRPWPSRSRHLTMMQFRSTFPSPTASNACCKPQVGPMLKGGDLVLMDGPIALKQWAPKNSAQCCRSWWYRPVIGALKMDWCLVSIFV